MNARVSEAWGRIERWLEANAPAALEHLGGPASPRDLETLEKTVGFQLPDEVKAIYSVHNGESGEGSGMLGGWDAFLPLPHVMANWRLYADLASQLGGQEDTPDRWRSSVEDGIIFIKGPVKPLIGSPRWIPITNMNGDVVRFLDFDPASGGAPGQVIEVDPEGCMHQVVASSFLEFLEQHAGALERGDYTVVEGDITRVGERQDDPMRWGLPEYLRGVELERFVPGTAGADPDVASLPEGQEVVIVGRMGRLTGGPEIVFTFITEQGTEYSILATRWATKGYGAIAVRQTARVTAERFVGQIESVFVKYGMAAPQLLARKYEMLMDLDRS
jgi:cell wall assembly regulator SMI1